MLNTSVNFNGKPNVLQFQWPPPDVARWEGEGGDHLKKVSNDHHQMSQAWGPSSDTGGNKELSSSYYIKRNIAIA